MGGEKLGPMKWAVGMKDSLYGVYSIYGTMREEWEIQQNWEMNVISLGKVCGWSHSVLHIGHYQQWQHY